MIKTVQFDINRPPMGKGRPRFSTFGSGKVRTYTPKTTKAYEELVKSEYKKQFGDFMIPPTPRGLSVVINAGFKLPQSKKIIPWAEQPQKKPDADNIAKIILDALNGVAYRDDKEITTMTVVKTYGEPKVSITLTYEEQEEENTK